MHNLTIFKLIDPDTKKVCLIGLTNRSASKTIAAIMREGSITKKANKLITNWVKEGKKPIIKLSKSTVGKHGTLVAIRDLGILLNAIVLEETLLKVIK